jgi:CheY-like chemotaxis protein
MTNQMPSIIILTAEDDPDDRVLVQDAFLESGQKNTLLFVQDGNDLLQYLHRWGRYAGNGQAPRPDLILLDLNMPNKDGRQALAEIKADPNLRSIPVVVLTGSKSDEDILNTYKLGGAGFIIKPETFQGLVEVIRGLNQYWFEVVELVNGERMNTINHNHQSSANPGERVSN